MNYLTNKLYYLAISVKTDLNTKIFRTSAYYTPKLVIQSWGKILDHLSLEIKIRKKLYLCSYIKYLYYITVVEMSLINIGDSIDPFYRYKRPRTICEHHKGRTIIVNLEDIAKALHTKASYITYYIQLEKSTSATTNGEIKTIIPQSEVEKIINDFIEKYILCMVCRYPELVTRIYRKELESHCEACGHITTIPKNKFTKIIYKDYH